MQNRQTQVTVINHFDGAVTIILTYKSGQSGRPASHTWTSVGPGAEGSPPLDVQYKTGAFSPGDYWHVSVDVEQGKSQGRWESQGSWSGNFKECALQEKDENTLLRFTVTPTGEFRINTISAPCMATLKKLS